MCLLLFCISSGQSSPDEAQRVVFLQDERSGAFTAASVAADDAQSAQGYEKQEGSLKCRQLLPLVTNSHDVCYFRCEKEKINLS